MSYKIKVHIADDHKILIEGVIALINIEDDIEVEGFSLTGREVINWSKKNTADILILDINMPDINELIIHSDVVFIRTYRKEKNSDIMRNG